jgi:hypothetical protein
VWLKKAGKNDPGTTKRPHLFFKIDQPFPVVFLGRGGVALDDPVRVPLRVTSDSNAKVIAILGPNVLDQVQSARVPALDLLKVFLTFGRVPPQSKDVAQPRLFRRLQRLVDLVRGHVSARQVHHRLHADEVLHFCRDVEGDVGRGPARAPRDVAEGGPPRGHAVEALQEVVDALLGTGGKELKAKKSAALGLGRADLVDDLHFGGRVFLLLPSSASPRSS